MSDDKKKKRPIIIKKTPDSVGESVMKGVVKSAKKIGVMGAIPKEIVEARYSICESCAQFDKDRRSCTICGCYMKAKTDSTNSSCPLEFWESYKKNKEMPSKPTDEHKYYKYYNEKITRSEYKKMTGKS